MRPSRSTTFVVLLLVCALTWIGVYAFLRSNDALGSIGAVSVFSSLVAAGLATLAGSVLTAPSRGKAIDPREGVTPGLRRVSPKSALNSSEWLKVLTSAKHEFFVAGHSLGRWCSATHRETFESNLARILRKTSGSVTFVLLDPDSAHLLRLQHATGTDYSDRIRLSLTVLAEFERDLPHESRSQLTVSTLGDHLALPYLVVGNERTLITATYMASSDSDRSLCLELDRESDTAMAIYDDFHRLAGLGEQVDLQSLRSVAGPERK